MSPSGVTSINAVAGVSEADGDAFAYILTDDASHELQILTGGPGNKVNESGTFESATFNAGSDVMFNSFNVTTTAPPLSQATYQIGIAHAINNSCQNASYTFVGPDGTISSSFSSNGQIPASTGPGFVNPGQCVRYRAYFTTSDTTQVPVMYDMNINYSP